MNTGQEVLQVVDDFVSLLSQKAEMNLDTIRRRDQVGTLGAVETALANEARPKVTITEEQFSPRYRAKYRCSQCGEITRLASDIRDIDKFASQAACALHPCFAGSEAISYGVAVLIGFERVKEQKI